MSSEPGDAGTRRVYRSLDRARTTSSRNVVKRLRGSFMRLTAIIEREQDGYVSLCPELDIASQGDSVERARENLREALELFF